MSHLRKLIDADGAPKPLFFVHLIQWITTVITRS